MNRRWVCNDVWMDIFPFSDRPQLGLKLALISPRFNALVDTYFDGKSELTIWRPIKIFKDAVAAVPNIAVFIDGANSVPFPLPDHPLPNKIGFKDLRIEYIDHSVITFLRSNQKIFGKGTNLRYYVPSSDTDDQPIWDVFVREIWPIFAPNIRRINFFNGDHLDNLRSRISPTILTDLNQLHSIDSYDRFPDATDGQALSKWLHTPRKDGQPKRLFCEDFDEGNSDWVNNFKEEFIRAITSVSYKIEFQFIVHSSTSIEPFELVNGMTNEKLTLTKPSEDGWFGRWIIKRCPINGETAVAINWEDENLNTVDFWLSGVKRCIGPLSPTPKEEKAGRSIEKGTSSDNE